jgi:hypothetical protein
MPPDVPAGRFTALYPQGLIQRKNDEENRGEDP